MGNFSPCQCYNLAATQRKCYGHAIDIPTPITDSKLL